MRDSIKRSLILILSIIAIIASPLQVMAGDGNGTGDDADGGGRYVSGGASYTKAAYLIYIVDKDGNPITPIVEAAINECKEPPLDANFDYELSKFGNKEPSQFKYISGVPTPFTSEGDGNGTELKNTLLSKNSDGNYKAAVLNRLNTLAEPVIFIITYNNVSESEKRKCIQQCGRYSTD